MNVLNWGTLEILAGKRVIYRKIVLKIFPKDDTHIVDKAKVVVSQLLVKKTLIR